jgi:hypothetical protein
MLSSPEERGLIWVLDREPHPREAVLTLVIVCLVTED